MTVISTSEGKRDDAIKGLGAHHFLVSKDKEAMKAAGGSFDGIIDTARRGCSRTRFHARRPRGFRQWG